MITIVHLKVVMNNVEILNNLTIWGIWVGCWLLYIYIYMVLLQQLNLITLNYNVGKHACYLFNNNNQKVYNKVLCRHNGKADKP